MKKRFFSVFVVFSMALTGCSFAEAIDWAKEKIDFVSDTVVGLFRGKHEHELSDWKSDEEKHWKECFGCEELFEEGNHTYSEWIIDEEPTCLNSGSQHKECEQCGYVFTESIPPTGHNPEMVWTSDELNHWHICSDCGEELDKANHEFEDWIIDKYPTCTEAGHKYKECHICGYQVGEIIPANGHSPQENWTSDGQSHWHICDDCGEELDKAAHEYGEWIIDKEPECTEEGHKYKECEICGYQIEEIIPAKGHSGASTWTNDEHYHWHICEDCGEELDKAGHNFGDWIIDDDPTCTEKGKKHKVCETCGYVFYESIDENGHSPLETWSSDENYHWHNCENCDEQLGKAVHEFDEWIVEVEPECTKKGSQYRLCKTCGYRQTEEIAAKGHSFGEWIRDEEPTPNDYGHEYHVCGDCGVIEENTIPKIVVHYVIIERYIYLVSEDNVTQVNLTYEGNYFNEDGILVLDKDFVTIDGNTYYLVGNYIQVGFQIINEKLYYFYDSGIMATNVTISDFDITNDGINDHIYFGSSGFASYSGVIIIYIYEIYYLFDNGTVISNATVTINIFEADGDLNDNNNANLSNVTVTLICGSYEQTVTTDSEGNAVFTNAHFGPTTIVINYNGYLEREIEYVVNSQTQEIKYAIDKEVNCTLNGRVLIADSDNNYTNNSPLPGATVTLNRVGNYVEMIDPMTTTTNSSGNYTFTGLNPGVYEIRITKENYMDVFDVVYLSSGYTTFQNVMIEAIDVSNVEPGSISGQVRDATKSTLTPIEGISVRLRSGVNVTYGEVLSETTTDSSGRYSFNVNPGNYTIEFIDSRAGTSLTRYSYTTLVVKVLSGTTLTGQDVALSPVVNGVRIVLSWGSSPSDLDSHTIFSGGTHIYYSSKTTSYGSLDVDDTTAYGPETTTVTSLSQSFTYYVYNYSGGGNYVLSNSGATVKVYVGNAETGEETQYSFTVPYSSGRYWNVFTYKASTGNMVFTNTVQTSAPSTPTL